MASGENKELSTLTRVIWITVSIVFIVNAFWLSILYRDELFRQSLEFIYEYQQNGNGFTRFVYNVFSFIAGTNITVVIMVVVLVCSFRKGNALVLVAFVAANVYVMALMKLAYADLRPSWYTHFSDRRIEHLDWTCETSYAFPSGHSWIILILHEAIVSDIVGTGPYYVFLLEPLVFVTIVPLSRLYLGAHATDQVVTSLVFAFAMAILYKLLIQRLLFKAVSFLITCNSKRATIIALGFQLVIFPLSIILYEINTSENRIGSHLEELNAVCETHKTMEEYEGTQAAEAGIGHVIAGGIYGLVLFRSKYFRKENGQKLAVVDYFLGNWCYGEKKFKNFALTALIYAVFGALSLGIFFVLIPALVDEFYVDYASKVLAWTLAGILLIRVTPELAYRWGFMYGLDDEELQTSAIMRNRSNREQYEKTSSENKFKG